MDPLCNVITPSQTHGVEVTICASESLWTEIFCSKAHRPLHPHFNFCTNFYALATCGGGVCVMLSWLIFKHDNKVISLRELYIHLHPIQSNPSATPILIPKNFSVMGVFHSFRRPRSSGSATIYDDSENSVIYSVAIIHSNKNVFLGWMNWRETKRTEFAWCDEWNGLVGGNAQRSSNENCRLSGFL